MRRIITTILFLTMFSFLFAYNLSNASVEIELVIENHKFIPEILKVPAGKKIKLTVINKDDTVEEFESADLKREKIIPSNGQIKLNIGPLNPGKYEFMGEFHQDTAKGMIIVD